MADLTTCQESYIVMENIFRSWIIAVSVPVTGTILTQ